MTRLQLWTTAGITALLLIVTVACDRDAAPPPRPTSTAPPLGEAVTTRVVAARTAGIQIGVTMANGSSKTELEGTVEIGPSSIRADLYGQLDGDPARVVVIDNDVYLQKADPGAWLRLRADGDWPFETTEWAAFDFLLEALHYCADAELLVGLNYTDSPGQDLDGVPVRTSLAAVDGDRFLSTLSEAQRLRFSLAFQRFTGARINLYLDDQQLPRRLIASLVGAYPTVAISYSDWGAPVSIVAPPAAQVVEPSRRP